MPTWPTTRWAGSGGRHRRRRGPVLPGVQPGHPGREFDPQARYISRWVPELAALPVKARFAPWQHPLLLAAHAPAIRVRRWWIWPSAAMLRWPPTGRRGLGKARAERSSQLAERGPVAATDHHPDIASGCLFSLRP